MSAAASEQAAPRATLKPTKRRVKTPTVLQMEAVECGAAALKIVLDYYGRHVPLEELRIECGVSRDGSKASNVVKAARKFGMEAQGYSKELDGLCDLTLPLILFWNFNHFVVLEGIGRKKVYLNDPAIGRRTVSPAEFDRSFTGVVLAIKPGEHFVKGGDRQTLLPSLARRLKGSGSALTYLVLAGLGIVGTGLILPAFTRVFVDNILVRGQQWIGPLLVGMLLTAAVRGALTWLQRYYLVRLETRLAIGMASKFFWHILSLPVEFFHQRFAGEIAGRVALNEKIARLLSGELATTYLNLLLAIFYAILMIQYDALLTMIVISFSGLNVAALRIVSRMRSDANIQVLQERGKLLGTTFVGLWMIETLKARGAASDFFARWSGYQVKSLNAEQRFGLANQFLQTVPSLLSVLTTMIVLVMGSLRVLNGEMTVGTLVAFQTLTVSFTTPISSIVRLGGMIQEVRGDMNRIDDLLRYERDPNVDMSSQPTDLNTSIVKLNGTVELRDVTFGYSRRARPLIKDFNLELKPGSRVALVGSSGSGKSTIAKLVAGLYQPWSGEILFDGQPRSAYPGYVIAKSLGIVDQDILIFEGSIRENLTLWDSTVPEADIIRAARDAAIHVDIASRVGGYDSTVEEGGRNFSGGQRQRLEIARAMVTNPTVIILDEATSALDPVTEQIIDANLRLRGCTCLIVAHRLSTIRDCDEIIVLDQGQVVERGSHQEMIAQDGPYRRLIASDEYEAGDKSPMDAIWSAL